MHLLVFDEILYSILRAKMTSEAYQTICFLYPEKGPLLSRGHRVGAVWTHSNYAPYATSMD